MHVRKATLDDIEGFMAVLAKVGFGDPSRVALRFYSNNPDAVLYVAEGGDEGILGTGLAMSYGHGSGWLGSIAVAPKHQHRGIGRALTSWGMNALWARGVRTLVLTATVSGRPLYEKFGFLPGQDYLAYKGPALLELPRDQSLRVLNSSDWGPVETLDLLATGETRGSFLRRLGRGYVVVREGEIQGYHVPNPWGRGGPAIADNPEVGRLLVDLARGLQNPGPVVIRVPEENRPAREYLEGTGFEIAGRAMYMVHGPWPTPYKPENIWGICSFAVG